MRQLFLTSRASVMAVTFAAVLAIADHAEARSIRVDGGDGSWEQNFANVLDDDGDTGVVTLPFEFFGTTTLSIDPRGFARSNAADPDSAPNLFPLIFSSDAPVPSPFRITFDWGGRDRDCDTQPELCGPDGERAFRDQATGDSVPIDTDQTAYADDAFRITWGVNAGDEFSEYQLVVWKLFNQDYVVEFNYDQIQGDLDESYLGFFLDPAFEFSFFADASSYGNGYIDLTNCLTFEGCAPGDNYVSPGFPPALSNLFLADIFGEPVTGRAIFYIDAVPGGNEVPEPGALALMLLGLAGVAGAARRRTGSRG